MKCLYNGLLILKDRVVKGKALIFDNNIQRIIDQEELKNDPCIQKIDANGKYISPGFIDLHIHGYAGFDTMDAEPDKLKAISKEIAQHGVTGFLPTTMTMKLDRIHKALEVIGQVKAEPNIGAEILGAHMEGPFISRQFRGAHDEKNIIPPKFEVIKGFEDIIKIITIAPELEGAKDFIDKVSCGTEIVTSMGHTNSTFEEAQLAFDLGISHVTHLFNAMTGLHHRKPGAVGAALYGNVTCELIADTIHVRPELYKLVIKTKGIDRVVLISDCVSAGGMANGEYELGGQKITVSGAKVQLADGTLAGSVLTLDRALQNVKKYTDCSIAELVQMVTYNPAKVISMDHRKGTLEIGKDADFTVFDEDFNIYMTIVKGKMLYEKDTWKHADIYS